jgi:FAD synthetase
MKSVLSIVEGIKLSKSLKKAGRRIVLVGGCFDILHYGHIHFLNRSKKYGDILVVLLEGDEFIKKTKGVNRPQNPQAIRAKVLCALRAVDFVIILPFMENNKEYDNLVQNLNPDVIATTKPDPNIAHKKRAAELSGAKLVFSAKALDNYSTSKFLG